MASSKTKPAATAAAAAASKAASATPTGRGSIAVSVLVGALAISYSIYNRPASSISSSSASSSDDLASSLKLTLEQAFNMTELSKLSFDELFGWSTITTTSTGEQSSSSASFREEWTKLQTKVNAMMTTSAETISRSVGIRLASEGIKPKHPVFMVPGFVTSGLVLWNGKKCAFPAYFRSKIWGSLETFRSFMADRECWKEHLSLDPTTGQDPDGIKLRSAEGFDAADYWTSAFWVWDRVIRNLAAIGYDSSNMAMVPYDWRLDYEMLEDRDGTFTKLKSSIEAYVKTNGQKAVIMGHSMGGPFVFTFLTWADDQEEGWCEKYIHTYLDLAGPMLGLPKAASALLSGEEKSVNAAAPIAGLIESVFGRKKRHELLATWGALWGMLPIGGDDIWGVGADIDCGEGRVQSGATCVDEVNGEDSTVAKRHVPLLTFTDDLPEPAEDDSSSVHAKYAKKETWTYEDSANYLAEWKDGHRGPESLKNGWNDVTKRPLPNSPSMNVYCMYGVGLPTERMFYYQRHGDTDDDVAFSFVQNIADDPSESVQIAVKMANGDGSVPLLSLGYTCAELWKEGSHLNPGNSKVTTREYAHAGSFQVDDPMRMGPQSSEHCDILGNLDLIEDILTIVSGSDVEEVVVSNIREIAETIRNNQS
mmetsp:Transcript_38027/g.92531  ORF Transcript_38027/g.92531 Transcript_38027/m.92531 type:complete len:649 (+) Transcript_38027:242-2188(+)